MASAKVRIGEDIGSGWIDSLVVTPTEGPNGRSATRAPLKL